MLPDQAKKTGNPVASRLPDQNVRVHSESSVPRDRSPDDSLAREGRDEGTSLVRARPGATQPGPLELVVNRHGGHEVLVDLRKRLIVDKLVAANVVPLVRAAGLDAHQLSGK